VAIYRQPPSPFIGGGQPLDPRPLPPDTTAVPENDPPFSSGLRSAAVLAVIVGMWQPAFAGLPQLGNRRVLVPEAVAAEVQPPARRDWLTTVLRAWEPAPPQPQVAWRVSPAELAVAENDPPFGQRTWLPGVLRAWEPGPPQPQVSPKTIQAVAEDNPPFSSRTVLPTVLRAWEPPPSQPQVARPLVPIEEAAEHVPFAPRASLLAILANWQQEPVQLQARRLANAGLLAVPENDPPFGQRSWLPGVLRAWEPGPPQPQTAWKLVPIEPAVVDAPPVGLRTRISSTLVAWEPPPPLIRREHKLPVQVTAVAENNPPFGQRLWLNIVLRAWEPAYYAPQAHRRPGATAPSSSMPGICMVFMRV